MSATPRARTFALAIAGLAATTVAHAGSCAGALGVSSENVYRGISQSEGKASAFGDVHCGFAQDWLAGIGANTIRAPQGRDDVQFTLYLDRRWRLGEDWSAKLGAVHYDTIHAENRAGFQYDELNAAIGWRGRWLTTIAWSPRVGNAYIGTPAGYNGWTRIETNWRQPLGDRVSVDAGLGYARPSGPPPDEYRYANLTLNATIGNAYLSLSRVWTSSLTFRYADFYPPFEFTFPAKRRWVGSVVWVF